jgi:hypothetical protein
VLDAFCHESLAMWRKLYPAERYPQGHPDLARSLENLGHLVEARGRLGRAQLLYREALAMNQAGFRQVGELYGEIEALEFAARLPLMRDAYLSLSRKESLDSEVYAAVWQDKGVLMRSAARRLSCSHTCRSSGALRLTCVHDAR